MSEDTAKNEAEVKLNGPESSELSESDLEGVVGGGNSPSTDDIEQVLNIGSQSSGAGAGKVTFNPFSITRKVD